MNCGGLGAPGTAGKLRLGLHSSGRDGSQFGKWVLLPEAQREPLPQEGAALLLPAGPSEQSLHFVCKDLREGGQSFVLGLQMEPACFSVQKNVQGLELLAVTAACSMVHVVAPSALELSGQPCCLYHIHHRPVSLALPLWGPGCNI